MARVKKWTQEALEALVQEFRDGASVASLAASYSLSRIRIYQLLKQAGVVVRGKQANLGPETEAAIIQIEEATNAN